VLGIFLGLNWMTIAITEKNPTVGSFIGILVTILVLVVNQLLQMMLIKISEYS